MLSRIAIAIAVLFLVGLFCIFLGTILPGFKVPVLDSIAHFFTTWAWPIGLAFGLAAFATGWNPFGPNKVG